MFEDNAIIITVANYLKYLCCDLINMSYEELIEKKDNGYVFDVVPDERWFKIISKRTQINIDDVKKELENKHITTIRELLQVIGTDVIRKYNENWHVNKMIDEIESYSEDKLIVIDDIRFPNEKKAVIERGGEVFFIIRPNVLEVSNHSSETALKWQDFDDRHIIINNVIGVERFWTEFKLHYKNDFDIFIASSLFLYENESFKINGNFGYNCEKDDFLTDLLSQINKDRLFADYGIIRYTAFSKENAERYIKEVDSGVRLIDGTINKFTTYNPLITENLKMYL